MKNIEMKFKEEFKKTQIKFKEYIENARKELHNAVKLSEETGIPFISNVVEFERRAYLPLSFKEKWKDIKLTSEIIEDEDFYIDEYNDGGWDFWRSSSLTC